MEEVLRSWGQKRPPANGTVPLLLQCLSSLKRDSVGGLGPLGAQGLCFSGWELRTPPHMRVCELMGTNWTGLPHPQEVVTTPVRASGTKPWTEAMRHLLALFLWRAAPEHWGRVLLKPCSASDKDMGNHSLERPAYPLCTFLAQYAKFLIPKCLGFKNTAQSWGGAGGGW